MFLERCFNNENDSEIEIKPNQITILSTGIKVEIPQGKCGVVKCRSSLAYKYGLQMLEGIIDSGYRGEIKVIFIGCVKSFLVLPGDRIAQLIIVNCYPQFEIVDELSDTDRGIGGFGSTGR